KVRRPGVAEGVRADLRVIDALARPLGAALPAVDVVGLVREARARVGEEHDLEHEDDAARRLARALRGHPRFVLPMPVPQLTDAGGDALALAREIAAELLGGSAPLDLDRLVAMRDRALARLDRVAALVARTTVPPEDLWPLRMLVGLALTLAPLGASEDWVAV